MLVASCRVLGVTSGIIAMGSPMDVIPPQTEDQ